MVLPFEEAGFRGIMQNRGKLVKTIIDKAEEGTATEKDLNDLMLFSPFALEDVDQEMVMFGAAAIGLYLSKTDRGMKLLETLVEKYFKTVGDIVGSVAKGGSTHVISSLTGQMIVIRMMRRLGLITNAEANQIQYELSWTINKIAAVEVIGQITHVASVVFEGVGGALLGAKG
jgi:hypothetical protein